MIVFIIYTYCNDQIGRFFDDKFNLLLLISFLIIFNLLDQKYIK
jgi:hypothetical protein